MKLFKAILGWVLAVAIGIVLGFTTYYLTNQKTFSFKDVLNKYLSKDDASVSKTQNSAKSENTDTKYIDQSLDLQYVVPSDSLVMAEAINDFSTNEVVAAKKYRLVKKESVEVKFYDTSVFIISGLQDSSLSKYEITTLKAKLKKLVINGAVAGKSEELLFGLNNVVKTKFTNAAWSSDMDVYETSFADKYLIISQKIDPELEVVSSAALTKLLESVSSALSGQEAQSVGGSLKAESAHSALLDNQVEI